MQAEGSDWRVSVVSRRRGLLYAPCACIIVDMTTARQQRDHGAIAPIDAAICEIVDEEIRRFNRERRRRNERKLGQGQIAVEVFGRNQAWLSKRLLGEIAFTPSEMIAIGDYLGANILDWLELAKRSPHGPGAAVNPWALRGSNSQPTDYYVGVSADVIELAPRLARHNHLMETA